jgi:hypothetical protein
MRELYIGIESSGHRPFGFNVEIGAADRGLAQALATGGFDIEAAGSRTG